LSEREDELVTFKCPSALLKELDEALKGRYNNRTAFFIEKMRKEVDRHLAVQANALKKKITDQKEST
jgi:metal-responsive CopG/Arc/MetJ family transcriptional regulator